MKVYIVIRNGDKHGNESIDMVGAAAGAKYVSKGHCKTYTNQSSTSTAPNNYDTGKTSDTQFYKLKLLIAFY